MITKKKKHFSITKKKNWNVTNPPDMLTSFVPRDIGGLKDSIIIEYMYWFLAIWLFMSVIVALLITFYYLYVLAVS